jgi:cytidylate kinase
MILERVPAIAIDGPASSGKSTLAREVARRMGFRFVDTGSLYRAVALALLDSGVERTDDPAIPALLKERTIALLPSDNGSRVILDGADVNDRLRSEEVGALASRISALPSVREKLFEIQRRIALDGQIVMDGRDIGTVILPEAKLKIYLVADPAVRAERRMKDLVAQGDRRPFELILSDILERDRRDRTRAIAPLVQAPDALLLDTTHLSIDEAVLWIIDKYR